MNNQNGFSTNCQKCGRTIYEGEMLNVSGKYVCEKCANSYIFERSEPPRGKVRRVPSAFLHFCFSMLPGAGHMYLGLMKTGLMYMILFFLCSYLTGIVGFFGIPVAVIWFYCFFDSLSQRRKIVNGEYVSDDISKVTGWLSENKGVLIIAGVALLCYRGISGIFNTVYYMFANAHSGAAEVATDVARSAYHGVGSIFSSLPFWLIVLGIYFIFKSRKNKKAAAAAPPADDMSWVNNSNINS